MRTRSWTRWIGATTLVALLSLVAVLGVQAQEPVMSPSSAEEDCSGLELGEARSMDTVGDMLCRGKDYWDSLLEAEQAAYQAYLNEVENEPYWAAEGVNSPSQSVASSSVDLLSVDGTESWIYVLEAEQAAYEAYLSEIASASSGTEASVAFPPASATSSPAVAQSVEGSESWSHLLEAEQAAHQAYLDELASAPYATGQ